MTSPSPVVSAEISSPGKSSLTSWWKNLKQKNQQDDNQDIPINNLDNSNSSKKHHHHHHHHNIHNLLHPDNDQENSSNSNSNTSTSEGGKPIRPFLGFKSRSSFSVRPLSLYDNSSSHQQTQQLSTSAYSSGSSHEKLRLHRDSFIQQRQQEFFGDSQVFGVPLAQSIDIAEGKIFITSDDDDLVRYGRIPRVIASCGSFLKQNGLDIEGIFRVAGSARRVKQLQLIFSSPPDYGSKIDWDGFTVHDSASLFRKFLGSLPEPLIPLSLYFAFREPLQKRPLIVKWLKEREKKLVPSSNDTTSTTTTAVTPAATPSKVNTTSKLPAKSTKSNLTSALSATKNQSESTPSSSTPSDAKDANKIESTATTQNQVTASAEDGSKSAEVNANDILSQQRNDSSKVDDSTTSLAKSDAREEATKVTETIPVVVVEEPAESLQIPKPKETETQESTIKKPSSNKTTTIKKKSKKSEKLRKEKKEALKEYAQLFDQLPSLQKQLLFYILDLMAIFTEHADKNLMPAKNLAAVFQPSILSHTDHDMSPEEYTLSSLVIEFMIQYSYKILPAAQVYAQKLNKNNINKSKKNLEDEAESQKIVVDASNNNEKDTKEKNDDTTNNTTNDTTNNKDTNTIPKSTSRSSLQNPEIIIEENQSEIESSLNNNETTTQQETNIPVTITQHNKTETLPPNSFQRFTRKHSKSLSSVQNPSDMLRVNSRKLPSPASSLGTSDYPSIKGNHLSLVVSNITDDGGISDSAMDTEDDDVLADSRTRSSSFEVSNKASLLQSVNNNNNSNSGGNLITPTSSEFPLASPAIPSLPGNRSIHSSSPNVSPSKLSKVITFDKQHESVSPPPAIKVDNYFVQGSQNHQQHQQQQDNVTPIKSNNSIYKSPSNITSSHSIISGSGSPSNHSGFLQHLTRPLSMFGSPRMRASSIDGSIDNSLSLKNVISSNESLKLSSPKKQNTNGLAATNTNGKNDSTGNLLAPTTSITLQLVLQMIDHQDGMKIILILPKKRLLISYLQIQRIRKNHLVGLIS
ncbi:unnamed protein product [[Candida] boidinii]|nr:unnamed protein product [[Candida] boidinii]